MEAFFAIDFDGTVARIDVIDAVLERFADPRWQEVEKRWQEGLIGSAQCLAEQMALVRASRTELLRYVSQVEIDETFIAFADRLKRENFPMAIISDGFTPFIREILAAHGMDDLPVYANALTERAGEWRADFPYRGRECAAGTCKCQVAFRLAGGRPVFLVGDGRSDFCLARSAGHVYAKDKLAEYCRVQHIPHTVYRSFADIALEKAAARLGAVRMYPADEIWIREDSI